MNIKIFVILFLLCLLCIIFYYNHYVNINMNICNRYSNENFTESDMPNGYVFITDYTSEDFLDNSDNFSIFSDPMFSDIQQYSNTINEKNIVVESGVEKCIKNCEGNCIEYGYTGIGICFPSNWIAPTTEEMASMIV
jgi:hypothetical protein